jgi:type II secretory pathway pseudopilin PulG
MRLRPLEALVVVAVVALIAAGAARRLNRPVPGGGPRTEEDSALIVPVERTAAARMQRAAERRTQVLGQLAQFAGGTYISAVLAENDSVVRHWVPTRDVPLQVWVQRPAGVADWQPTWGELVKRGFYAWDGLDGQPVRFAFTDDSAKAQVIVVWTERLEGNRIGLTRTEALNDATRWARITMATRREGNVALKDADILRCAIHEVGHVLGLAHSPDPASIMAAESAQQGVDASDHATVRLLYLLPIGSVKAGATW